MTFNAIFEFARVLVSFWLIYIGPPMLALRRHTETDQEHVVSVVRLFIYTSLFVQVTILVLGGFGLALAPLVIAVYTLWILALLWSNEVPFLRSTAYRQMLTGRALSFLERHGPPATARGQFAWWRRMRLSLPRSCLILLLVIAVMERALFALGNLHFGDIDGYSRAMSLHVLNAGGQWQLDGSVALLSPLALISGLPPETVVRFSNPLFSALLVVAVGTCVFRLTRQLWAACIGCGLIAIAPLLLESTYSPRIDIAGAYTILALASLGSSALAATCAALIVLLSGVPTFEPLAAPIACVLLAALLGKALGRVHSIARQVLGLLCSILFSVVLLYAWAGHVPEGALQYEASARACAEIARRFTRNTWLVVSTTYERPFIYGRGWHLEMVEFVSTLSVEQVGNPEFVFPYSVRDLFLFLENQPLRQSDCENCWQNRPISVSQTIDIAVQSYVSPIGRASVEFSAAALIAAYLRSHRDLSVFYSDEHLTVYRVHLRDR